MLSNFNKANTLTGWLVFLIATFVYVSTIEPTASFWDCGEYIATAYKLEVGHPPGAPLFLIIANVFSNFAGGDVMNIAYWVNVLSALCSSFTILFLFWTITAFARKLVTKGGETLNESNTLGVLMAGAVGALTYTFSDSFWFSAVEGEVYAMSSFFTAAVFWAIMRWEREADEPDANRWLLLIAYLMGLSVGVHMLNLLCIPAIGMIYYFKKHKPTPKGFILANLASVGVLALIFKIIIPQVVNLAGKLELFFVNKIGLPFNSGTIVYFLILIAGIILGLRYTRIKKKPLLNTGILAMTFILIGYATFMVLIVRSNANTPIDENNPEDAVGMLAYLNREQYGDWPILYGQYFNAALDAREPYTDGTPFYVKDEAKGKYVVSDDRKGSVRNFEKVNSGFFPRMWSTEKKHLDQYKTWAGIPKNDNGKPSFGENIKYFFNFQIGHMYLRYFLWNFAGRQNDIQGHGNPTEGNWISGINFIDEWRLGPQENLPKKYGDNKGRNKYYFFPLILGLIGMFFHYKRSQQDFYVMLQLFLLTGAAIILYLNPYPLQPRERDYAYVGSFYAFAIWVGLGVFGIYEWLKTKAPHKLSAGIAGGVCLFLVPGIMAKENWDDHDRSNRYTARDIAKNYLDSCDKNAILFTNGDNDTFPLWYVQEVEGYRTDVRIVNLSLLNTDWYVDQMKRAAYDSESVPFSLEKDQYKQGTRDAVFYVDKGIADNRWMAKDFIKWVSSDAQNTKVSSRGSSKSYDFYPVKKLRVPVDKQTVLSNGTVNPADSALVLDHIDWDFNKGTLYKRDLMIVDLIAQNNWERPIYFSITVGNSAGAYMNLTEYFELEGMAYKLVPIKYPKGRGNMFGKVDTETMYDNMMNKFQWGNLNAENVYLDQTNRRMTWSIRNNFGRLANELVLEGKPEKAIAAVDKCMEIVHEDVIVFDYFVLPLAEVYYRANARVKGADIVRRLGETLRDELIYYAQFEGPEQRMIEQDIRQALSIFNAAQNIARQYKDSELAKELEEMQTAFAGKL
ncbi:MAG: hypothetical protein ACI8P7_000953 [Candidatus Azotimanducaceae bacterium]|jgi:hypothetical protein